MTGQTLSAIFSGGLVGFALGLVGGGGSILATPSSFMWWASRSLMLQSARVLSPFRPTPLQT